MTLEDMLKNNGHSEKNGMVLKMDIEGAEWDVLDMLSEETIKKFDQIIMELHGLLNIGNADKILRVLEKLNKSHEVIHIHGNNVTRRQFVGNFVTSDCIEITYVLRGQYQTEECVDSLPTILDYPCNNELNEVVLGKWNL